MEINRGKIYLTSLLLLELLVTIYTEYFPLLLHCAFKIRIDPQASVCLCLPPFFRPRINVIQTRRKGEKDPPTTISFGLAPSQEAGVAKGRGWGCQIFEPVEK